MVRTIQIIAWSKRFVHIPLQNSYVHWYIDHFLQQINMTHWPQININFVAVCSSWCRDRNSSIATHHSTNAVEYAQNLTIMHYKEFHQHFGFMLHLRPLCSFDHAGVEPRNTEIHSNASTEQALVLCDVTTKVLVKCHILQENRKLLCRNSLATSAYDTSAALHYRWEESSNWHKQWLTYLQLFA